LWSLWANISERGQNAAQAVRSDERSEKQLWEQRGSQKKKG